MAKLSSIQKNQNRLKLIKKFSNKRKALKNKIMDKSLSIEDRLKMQNKLNDLPRNSSNIRYRNRCKLTGRTRGYRKFGLSRIKIRELSMSGDYQMENLVGRRKYGFNDSLSDMLARIKTRIKQENP